MAVMDWDFETSRMSAPAPNVPTDENAPSSLYSESTGEFDELSRYDVDVFDLARQYAETDPEIMKNRRVLAKRDMVQWDRLIRRVELDTAYGIRMGRQRKDDCTCHACQK